MNEIEIVLVEDDGNDVELTLQALRDNGLVNRIQVVRDGEEALDFIFCRGAFAHRSFLIPPKLILLDLGLPRLDGLEVLALLKADARTQSVPVLVLTSSADDRNTLRGLSLGVDGYVRKPIDFRELRDALRDAGFAWLLGADAASPSVGSTPSESVL